MPVEIIAALIGGVCLFVIHGATIIIAIRRSNEEQARRSEDKAKYLESRLTRIETRLEERDPNRRGPE